MNLINLLEKDHANLRVLMSDLKSDDKNIELKKEIFSEQFVPLLYSHTESEERTVLFYSAHKRDLKDQALEGIEEHELVEDLVDKVNRTRNSELWKARVKVLCDCLEHHLKEEEEELFPRFKTHFSDVDLEKKGEIYMEIRNETQANITEKNEGALAMLNDQSGKIGYIIAWLFGVPVSLLFVIFLIRGH